MMYEKEKILIVDFDILNNSLHTILGVKKHPIKIKENINIENINLDNYLIKINKKIDLISAESLIFNTNEKMDDKKAEKIILKLKEKYNTIIIDTSSECFFDFTKTIIKLSQKNIFVTESNMIEIKKAKKLLDIYTNKWNIKKEKFNIVFNKYDKNCINMNLLKEIFNGFNIAGTLKYNAIYNRLINKNIRSYFCDKDLRKEYLAIKHKLN